MVAVIAVSLALPAQAVEQISKPAPLGSDLTRRFPYSMVGQIIFSSGDYDYQGTSTLVYRRSALTAAHNLWDADNGWSYNLEFNRARSGASIPKTTWSSRMYVFGGYQSAANRFGADSARAFASDLGGIRFQEQPADGSYAGWKQELKLVTGNSYNVCLGYGADVHSGDDLLFVEPSYSFYQTYSAFFENDSLIFESGMSGGPVFADIGGSDLRIVGVIVAGSEDPPSGGIRAINASGARFISTYLRY
jgi:hypothetical protein